MIEIDINDIEKAYKKYCAMNWKTIHTKKFTRYFIREFEGKYWEISETKIAGRIRQYLREKEASGKLKLIKRGIRKIYKIL